MIYPPIAEADRQRTLGILETGSQPASLPACLTPVRLYRAAAWALLATGAL